MQFLSKVFIKFSAAAIAIASILGCGSGSAKPFSAGTATTSVNNSGSGSNSGSSSAPSTPGTTPAPAPTPTTTSAPAPTTAPPVPANQDPAGAIVYASLQSQPGWQTCGGCGNAGGSGQGPDYHMSQGISNPSLSGSAADFYVNGGPAYTGGYYFIEQPTIPNPVTYLRYDFDLFVPGQYANAPQAIEFECQQTANGNIYNFAWQADYASNSWRVFNYTTKQWEGTGIPLQRFAPDTWHHIAALFHAAGTQAIHDSITVDGQTMGANITHQATATGTGLEFSAGFQVDLDSRSTPYHVYVDNMKVTATD